MHFYSLLLHRILITSNPKGIIGFLLLDKKSKIESIYGNISFDSVPPILEFLKTDTQYLSIICMMMAAESLCLSNNNSVVELI